MDDFHANYKLGGKNLNDGMASSVVAMPFDNTDIFASVGGSDHVDTTVMGLLGGNRESRPLPIMNKGGRYGKNPNQIEIQLS